MTEEQDDEALDRMAGVAQAITQLVRDVNDEVGQAAIVTDVVASWLENYSDEDRPQRLSYLISGVLTALGHQVMTMVKEVGKIDDGEIAAAAHVRHHHTTANNEAARASVDLVIQKARELKLHGVVIMAPVCDGCGGLHDFAMASDLDFGRGKGLSNLLRELAQVAAGDADELRNIEGGRMQ